LFDLDCLSWMFGLLGQSALDVDWARRRFLCLSFRFGMRYLRDSWYWLFALLRRPAGRFVQMVLELDFGLWLCFCFFASRFVQDLDVEAGSLFGSCVEVLWDDGRDEILRISLLKDLFRMSKMYVSFRSNFIDTFSYPTPSSVGLRPRLS
jgi:hypothetical protein